MLKKILIITAISAVLLITAVLFNNTAHAPADIQTVTPLPGTVTPVPAATAPAAMPMTAAPASTPSPDFDKAVKLYSAGKYSEVITICDRLIKADPQDYRVLNLKGISQCYSGSFSPGLANIDEAIKISPKFSYAVFNKALALELYHRYDESIEWYLKAIDIDRGTTWVYPWMYYGIASIYGRKGNADETVKYLSKAIELNPATKEEAKTEKDFDNVRKYKSFQQLLK